MCTHSSTADGGETPSRWSGLSNGARARATAAVTEAIVVPIDDQYRIFIGTPELAAAAKAVP